jgi:hypothetical protein
LLASRHGTQKIPRRAPSKRIDVTSSSSLAALHGVGLDANQLFYRPVSAGDNGGEERPAGVLLFSN